MKKSFLFMVTVCFMIMTLLVGCGDKQASTDHNTPAKGNEDSSESKEKPVKLTWYTIGTPQKDSDVIEDELNKYLLEKINATVDIVMFDWGDYNEKMQVKIGSGEIFDIMFTCSWANDYATNVAKGALYPLNDLLEKQGIEIKDSLHPLFLEGAAINGEVYALPTNKELGWQAVWIINKDLADKYNMNLEDMTTLESLEPYLEMIKENEPDVIPLTLDLSNTPYVPNMDTFFGDQMPLAIHFDAPSKIINLFETDEALEIFKTMYSYYNKGYIHPDAAINRAGDYNKAGNFFITKAHYQPYAEVLWENGDYTNTNIAVRPIHEPFANNSSTRGAMQGISFTSKHPEKAMEFLNLLYTDPYVLNLIDYGIEGTHYEKMNDFHIKQLPRAQDAYLFPSFSIGNLLNTYAYEGTPEDKWEKFEEFNNACINAPSLGYTPDLSTIKSEMAAVTNVAKEVSSSLFMGAVDPDEYVPKAVEKLKSAGIDKVITELQSQYDAWQKTR